MSNRTITVPNVRRTNDVTIRVSLTDSGVAVDWTGLTDIFALAYSEEQRQVAARLSVAVDSEDHTQLILGYEADDPQYLGVCKVIIRCTYQGEEKTYDAPALNFVESTAEATGTITISDPDVSVDLVVEDVSTSLLDDAIAAAFNGAEAATAAAELANQKAGLADDAATLANQKAGLADDAATLANQKAGLADDAATLANQKAAAASDAATLANAKAGAASDAADLANQKAELADAKAGLAADAAALADEKADYADRKGDYAKDQGDYAKDQGDYAKAKGDYAKDQGDYAKGEIDGAKGDFESLDARFDHTEEVSVTLEETTDPTDSEYQDEYQRVLQVLYQGIDDSKGATQEAQAATDRAGHAADEATAAGSRAASATADATAAASDARVAAQEAAGAMDEAKGGYPSLGARLDSMENRKQDRIPDLDTIRAGAEAGAAAAPADSIAPVGYSGAYGDLTGAPTKLSDFTDDVAVHFSANDDPSSLLD